MTDLEKVKSKNWHTVRNKDRAKLIRNRGDDIRWSIDLDCWIWNFSKRFRRFQKKPLILTNEMIRIQLNNGRVFGGLS